MSREIKEELGRKLIHAAREHEAANQAFDEVAGRKLGLNQTDLRALNVVENEGPMTAGRLAESMGLTTAAITSVLDRLERAGYARRIRDDQDRRQVIVELTPLVGERAGLIWGPLGQDAAAAFARMSVDELESVIEYHRLGRELNERHIERVRNLEFDD